MKFEPGKRLRVAAAAVLALGAVVGVAVTVYSVRGQGGDGTVSAWAVPRLSLNNIPEQAAVTTFDDQFVFLGGTGATPENHKVAPGAQYNPLTGAVTELPAPPFSAGLANTSVQKFGDNVVVVGTPCLTAEALSSGDCPATAWAAGIYSLPHKSWVSIAAPPVPVGTPLDGAGVVDASAVFAVRGTGELFGVDRVTLDWTTKASSLAAADVSTCVLNGSPAALRSSYLVNGVVSAVPPAPTVEDGATVSGPEPTRVKPTLYTVVNGAWQERLVLQVESAETIELACGTSELYLLAYPPSGLTGPQILTGSLLEGTARATAQPPAQVTYDMLQHRALTGDNLLLVDSTGRSNLAYNQTPRAWVALPGLPTSLVGGGTETLGVVGNVAVVRSSAEADGRQLAILTLPNLGT